MASSWIARTSHITYSLCFWINFGIDHLPRWKGSLATGMNKLALSHIRKPGKDRFTSLTTEGDPGSIATQCIASVMGKEITTRHFLQAEAAYGLTVVT
jgi:hypothetical protein